MQHDIECSMDRSCEKVSRWSGGKEQDMEQGAEAGEGYGTVKRTEP